MKILKTQITLLLMFIIYQNSFTQVTQEWVQRYNGTGTSSWDEANAIAVDGSGNVYVTGYATETGDTNDYVTVKYNSSGTQLWLRKYNGIGDGIDQAYSIAVDASGNSYVTGKSSRGGVIDFDYITIKYNTNGDSLWVRRYSGPDNSRDTPAGLKLDNLGNVYVTGGSNRGIITIKYAPNGDSLWVKKYGDDYSSASSIEVDNLGNVYIAGGVQGIAYLTIKYNSSGILQWARYYVDPLYGFNNASALATDDSGNVYVTGTSYGGSTQTDYLTIKYNSNGDSLWVKRLSGTTGGFDDPYDIAVDGSGNVYVTGHFQIGELTSEYATVKYNSSGVQQWVQRYRGGNANPSCYAWGIALDAAGDIYVTGRGYPRGYITIKYNPAGDSIWVKNYQGPTSGASTAEAIAVDALGNVYVTGYSQGTGSNSVDYATVKYSQQSSKTLQLTALIEGLYNITKNKMIKDTARVYLRSTSSPYAIVDSAKSVLDSNGKGTFSFPNAINGTPYYIVVKHRNAIDTWSSTGPSFTSNSLSYDFTTSADKAYGNNLIQKGSRFCIYSGDVNRDGSINLTDVIAINNDLANFVTGYNPTDINGDNQSDLFDLVIAYNNSLKFITAQYPGSLDISKSAVLQKKSNEIKKFELRDNYPNPFNPKTVISYELRVTNYVSLKVYDIAGKEVAVLVNEKQEAGNHSVIFDAAKLSSGAYFYKLQSDGMTKVKRMMVVK